VQEQPTVAGIVAIAYLVPFTHHYIDMKILSYCLIFKGIKIDCDDLGVLSPESLVSEQLASDSGLFCSL